MTTPLESYPDLAQAIGVSSLYFKREDMHPYGSHKGRSIPHMIDEYRSRGETRFAISSSGNAALAAAMHIKKLNERTNEVHEESLGNDDFSPLELDIFVGNHIAPNKEDKLKAYASEYIRILKKERPLQALTEAMHSGARSLRQSTDDLALVGYESLGQEIADAFSQKGKTKSSKSNVKSEEKIGAIFIGTSSGTTAQALASFFLNKAQANESPVSTPQIHIVQTSTCHPLADAFNSYDGPTEEYSDADAITDITALRKIALTPLIEKTGGSGWYATNEDIETAQMLVKKHAGIDISPNSALSVVGAMQSVYAGHNIDGAVICLICGE